jgi:hypothetical protein
VAYPPPIGVTSTATVAADVGTQLAIISADASAPMAADLTVNFMYSTINP